MGISIGSTDLSAVYIGDTAVDSIYQGDTMVWGEGTPTYLYLTLTDSSLTHTLYFTQSEADGVTIDWGDGSTPETPTGTESTGVTPTVYYTSVSHTYATADDYVVTMTVADGVTWGPGKANAELIGTGFLNQANNKSNTYPQLTAFEFGLGCTSIFPCAFYGCTSLTSVRIPDTVSFIGWGAFQKCTDLTETNIPSSVSLFGTGASAKGGGSVFYDCTGLRNIEIASPTVGSVEIFYGCSSLEKVWIRNTVDTIMNYIYTNSANDSYYYGICTGSSQNAVLYCEDTEAQPLWENCWDKRDATTESSGFATFTKVFGQTTSPF